MVPDQKRKKIALKQQWSWAAAAAWTLTEIPYLPSTITDLFKHCAETKAARLPTESCPCLTYLELRWDESLGCIFCIKHRRLMPGNYIWPHIGERGHPAKFAKTTVATVYRALLSHASHCHPAIINQSTADLKESLPLRLDEPLSLLLPPESTNLRYKCPVHGCRVWSAINRGKGSPQTEHVAHFKTHSQEEQRSCTNGSDVLVQRTQMVDIGAGRSKLKSPNGGVHYFILPDTNDALSSTKPIFEVVSLTRCNPAAPSAQDWSAPLGWDDYIHSIGAAFRSPKDAKAKLRELIARPSITRVINAVDDTSRALEKALLAGYVLNKRYLEEGAQWVTSLHPSVAERFSYKTYVFQLEYLSHPDFPLERSRSKHLQWTTRSTNIAGRSRLLNACSFALCLINCTKALQLSQFCIRKIHYGPPWISWS